jgi:hypothetical protein
MMTAVWLLTGGFVALALVWLRDRLAGFSAQRPADYADAPGEAMDIRRHLNGALEAEGVIYGPTGRVTSRFRGDFVATWEGNTCVLHERYLYASGVEEERAWHLTLGNDGRIRATAADVVGEGSGRQSGPSVQMRYRLRLPEDKGGIVLNATDWMYLTPDGTIVNRSQFRKLGLKVAELVAVMRRKEVV